MHSQKDNRYESVDIAKGIGMLCLVLGHLFIIGSDAFKIIFAFHMPLFFFLSGLLFIPSKYTPKAFFQNKIGKLILTYLVFVVIGIIFCTIFYEIYLKTLILSVFWRGEPYMASALWFVTVLAIIWSICYLIPIVLINRLNRWGYMLLIITICLAASIYFSLLPEKFLHFVPLKLESLPLSFLFFFLGYFCQSMVMKIPKQSPITLVTLVMGGGIILILCALQNGVVDLRQNMMGNPLLFMAGAASGIVLVLALSNMFHSKLLSYIGRYSILFFLWEGFARDITKFIMNHFMGTSYTPMIDLPLKFAIVLFPIVTVLTYWLTRFSLSYYQKYLETTTVFIFGKNKNIET